ncbi:DUF3558 family protein [Corynebacterium aquilae]|uniref:DUF3558 domain-containing protein n=1 Tax=Corynebacterium aquilae DSM 44791 TaxID=1431546 RepID=A0A1L7CHW1_9CORY|nr:DUF3558 family protein [Corynebacterium aquilae]APT85440.1 hypothetical protein CAQU_10700 [Corynebacterium aquilae DSM 44791]
MKFLGENKKARVSVLLVAIIGSSTALASCAKTSTTNETRTSEPVTVHATQDNGSGQETDLSGVTSFIRPCREIDQKILDEIGLTNRFAEEDGVESGEGNFSSCLFRGEGGQGYYSLVSDEVTKEDVVAKGLLINFMPVIELSSRVYFLDFTDGTDIKDNCQASVDTGRGRLGVGYVGPYGENDVQRYCATVAQMMSDLLVLEPQLIDEPKS